jgi:hypothetical protein
MVNQVYQSYVYCLFPFLYSELLIHPPNLTISTPKKTIPQTSTVPGRDLLQKPLILINPKQQPS